VTARGPGDCAEILALQCRGPMLAHALPGPRRRTRFWRYTSAQRMAPSFWLRPTTALRRTKGYTAATLRAGGEQSGTPIL